MTRAQVAVEMLCLSVNGIFEFKEGPTLEEVSLIHSSYGTADSLCVDSIESCFRRQS